MPQLDTVSFFSQYFWLCIFFGGFYLNFVKYFLPKMGRIQKVRQQKMTLSEGGISHYQTEGQTVNAVGEKLVVTATKEAKSSLLESTQMTWNWSVQVLAQAHADGKSFPSEEYNKTFETSCVENTQSVTTMNTCVSGAWKERDGHGSSTAMKLFGLSLAQPF
jgi:hypothetical protein